MSLAYQGVFTFIQHHLSGETKDALVHYNKWKRIFVSGLFGTGKSQFSPQVVRPNASFSYTLPRAMMSTKLSMAPDMLAIIWAIGRSVSSWKSGMATNVRQMITATMNIRTRLICKDHHALFLDFIDCLIDRYIKHRYR